ncbi:MAG: hypothetical protein S4CHLAM45_07480 [Chlamydiales bacterium]|nr:hypothetical protein [Chlamydiales bacterium]MCH9620600.1 hypothetical protein [Chlamydiales bacterium]MCH9622855.1 hypothetical protein [Chlamydiales bacterium]
MNPSTPTEFKKLFALINPYFKPDIQQGIANKSLNYLELSIKDMDPISDPNKLKTIENLFKQILTNELVVSSRSQIEVDFQKIHAQYTMKHLHPDRLEVLNEDIKERAEKTAAKKTEAFFKKNYTLSQMRLIPGIPSELVIDPSDFIGINSGQPITRQQENNLIALSLRLQRSQAKRMHNKEVNLRYKIEQMVSIQKERAQLLAYVSKKTGTSIDDLDDGAIETYREAFDKAKADAAEAKRVEAEAELLEMWEDSSAPAQSQQIKKKKEKTTKGKGRAKQAQAKGAAFAQPKKKSQAKKPKPLSPKQQTIQRLNGPQGKLLFSSHPRVQRWQTTDHEVMRTFGESYRQHDEEDLIYLRNVHNLAGVERIVSDLELKERYSYPSSHVNKAGVEQTGRKFFASMKSGKKTYSGVVHLGINEESGEIFHAMFTQLQNPNFSPSELKRLQVEEIEEEKAEGGWELVSTYQFDIDADDVLHMKTGVEKNNQVHFSFYPLNFQS